MCHLLKSIGALLLIANTTAFTPSSSSFGITSSSSIQQHSFALYAGRGGGNRGRGRAPVVEKKPPMNDEVPSTELRVVTPNPKGKDEPLGVMSKTEALAKAQAMGGLDLILVNPNSDPPVCKIVDYSKYRYMQEKKAKEVKKNSKASEMKEVKMSYKIDVHDYGVRKKNAEKFLLQGNRVKCTVMFRGREVQHDKLGFELLDKMAAELEKTCVKEGKAKREGRNLSLILTPRPEVLKLVNENRRKQDKDKKKKKEAEKKQHKEAKAAAAAAAAASVASSIEALDDEESSLNGSSLDDDGLDLDSSLESSLDDLFGSDDLTDDLFS